MPQAVFREQRNRGGSITAPIFTAAVFSRLDFQAWPIGSDGIADRIESIDAFARAVPIEKNTCSIFEGSCQTAASHSKRTNLTSRRRNIASERWGLFMKRLLVQLLLVFLWASTVNAVSSLTIGWQDNASNEDGFTVERATSISGPFSPITTVGADVTSYTDTNLAEATSFCYRVNAFNTSGASPYTPVACGTTQATLNFVKAGTGAGQVTSAVGGMNCAATCTTQLDGNSSVTLTATPSAGSVFAGWSGACTGTGSCTIAMNSAMTVTATFNTQAVQTFILTVAKAGTGSGTVTATGISCGSDCTETYNNGTAVTLAASATSGSTFTGWSGTGCSTGTVTLSADRTCTATFNTQAVPTFHSHGGESGYRERYGDCHRHQLR